MSILDIDDMITTFELAGIKTTLRNYDEILYQQANITLSDATHFCKKIDEFDISKPIQLSVKDLFKNHKDLNVDIKLQSPSIDSKVLMLFIYFTKHRSLNILGKLIYSLNISDMLAIDMIWEQFIKQDNIEYIQRTQRYRYGNI